MPPAHALLGLLPHREAGDPADLARGIADLRPLVEAVPVYEGSAGSDRMAGAVESLLDGAPGRFPGSDHDTRVWAEVRETSAARAACREEENAHG
jgi:hypothetical protein